MTNSPRESLCVSLARAPLPKREGWRAGIARDIHPSSLHDRVMTNSPRESLCVSLARAPLPKREGWRAGIFRSIHLSFPPQTGFTPLGLYHAVGAGSIVAVG